MQISHPVQRGMTGYQMLLVVLIVLFVAYTAIRLAPIYLEYFNVVSSLNSVSEKHSGQTTSAHALQQAVLRQFRINTVRNVDRSHIRVTKDGRDYLLEVQYEARTHWIGNIDLVVSYERQVRVPGV